MHYLATFGVGALVILGVLVFCFLVGQLSLRGELVSNTILDKVLVGAAVSAFSGGLLGVVYLVGALVLPLFH